MSKKTKTKSDQTTTFNNTSSPTNPEWVTNGLSTFGDDIMNLRKMDPYSLVAGTNSMHDAAKTTMGGLGASSGNFGQSNNLLNTVAGAGANTYAPTSMQGSSLLDGLENYMSPYRRDVVDSALADYDHGAAQQNSQAMLDLNGSGALGGSRSAIRQAMLGADLTRGRAATSSNLLNQMFNTGASLSGQDADRRQQASLANMQASNAAGQFNAGQQDSALARMLAAAQGLTGNATAEDANTRANAGSQMSLADMLRQIQQAQLVAPISQTATLSGLFGSQPLGLLQGQTSSGTQNSHGTSTTTTSDPMGSIAGVLGGIGGLATGLGALGSAGGIASVFASDRRLKSDIRKVGDRKDGLGIYEFNYKGKEGRFRGVMADEVKRLRPEAYVRMDDGTDAVDYSKLGAG